MFDPVETEKLSKGMQAFHVAPGHPVQRLPEDYLSDYLDAFIEEAYEHEYEEKRHQAPRLEGGDPYMHLARAVYNELLAFAVNNKNLLRAVTKFKIMNPKFVLERLDKMGLCRVNSSNYDADESARVGGYYPERIEPLAVHSPAHGAYKSMDAMFGAVERESIDRSIRGGSRLAPKEEMVRLESDSDPYALLKQAHSVRSDPFGRNYVRSEIAKANVDSNCIIHGSRDLTKSMNLANVFAHCTCQNPSRV